MNKQIREVIKEADRKCSETRESYDEILVKVVVQECVARINRVGILEDIELESNMIADAVLEHFGMS